MAISLFGKEVGFSPRYINFGDGTRCFHGVIWWSFDGKSLRYKYPSLTFYGWRPHIELQ